MRFGDYVQYNLDGSCGRGWIIGETNYSPGEVFVLASMEYIGMPINKYWLRVIDGRDLDIAEKLRAAYLDKFPTALKHTPNSDEKGVADTHGSE